MVLFVVFLVLVGWEIWKLLFGVYIYEDNIDKNLY